jgi:CMP-N-acetylneuraminic acid synthetase
MSQVIALVPARVGSKGIKHKNFRRFDGPLTLTSIAVGCAITAGCDIVAVSSDAQPAAPDWLPAHPSRPWIRRPAELASDTAPMLAVVQHALEAIPGEPDDVIVLLQPTQPFRKPEHITEAIRLLRETQADSVVSVVPLPLTHSPDFAQTIHKGRLTGWLQHFDVVDDGGCDCEPQCSWHAPQRPALSRRQDARPAYIRDGTCYTFRRETVTKYRTIYGRYCVPLVIHPNDTCQLDDESDWLNVVERWEKREALPGVRSRETSSGLLQERDLHTEARCDMSPVSDCDGGQATTGSDGCRSMSEMPTSSR